MALVEIQEDETSCVTMGVSSWGGLGSMARTQAKAHLWIPHTCNLLVECLTSIRGIMQLCRHLQILLCTPGLKHIESCVYRGSLANRA